MSVNSYLELSEHVGHEVVCITYGRPDEEPVNVAIECETCGVVLLDYDNESKEA